MMAPARPVLRWHGGKWKLAPWLMSHFPPHRIYVEPFGGAGSVLLRKPRAYAEVYNDLDDEVVTLFRVLQDPAASRALIKQLHLTPFARREFELSGEAVDEPVERSRRLIVRAFLGFGSNAHAASTVARRNGFRTHARSTAIGRQTGFRANSNRSGTTPAHDWLGYPASLALVVERLRGVIIEHRDAVRVILQHDGRDTLHYVDPPYLPETRAPANKYDLKYRMYRHELDLDGHVALLDALCNVVGMVALSGYPAPLYDRMLIDWRRVETAAYADGARPRTEVLWLNPACAAALQRHHRAPVQMEFPADIGSSA
jgi:DNA adenine methylase